VALTVLHNSLNLMPAAKLLLAWNKLMVGTQVGCSALTAYAWPIPLAAGAAAGALHRPIELLGDCHCVHEKHWVDDVGLASFLWVGIVMQL
jgi:hypothetical protein